MEDALLKAVRELPMAEPPKVEVVDGTATLKWPLGEEADGWTISGIFYDDQIDVSIHGDGVRWSIESFAGADEEMLAALLDFERHLESLRWLVRLLIEMAGES